MSRISCLFPVGARTGLTLALSSSMGAMSSVHAAESDPVVIDPMVVTGSYAPTSTFNLPFSINTVDLSKSTDGQLGVNLSEVLSKVPGLVVQNRQNYAQDLRFLRVATAHVRRLVSAA